MLCCLRWPFAAGFEMMGGKFFRVLIMFCKESRFEVEDLFFLCASSSSTNVCNPKLFRRPLVAERLDTRSEEDLER